MKNFGQEGKATKPQPRRKAPSGLFLSTFWPEDATGTAANSSLLELRPAWSRLPRLLSGGPEAAKWCIPTAGDLRGRHDAYRGSNDKKTWMYSCVGFYCNSLEDGESVVNYGEIFFFFFFFFLVEHLRAEVLLAWLFWLLSCAAFLADAVHLTRCQLFSEHNFIILGGLA